jgi:hypothetical protein
MSLENIQVFVYLWAVQVVYLAAPSSLVFWITRKFAHYELWELLVFLVPFSAWVAVFNLKPKT